MFYVYFYFNAVSNHQEETLDSGNEDFEKYVPVNMGLSSHSESLKTASEIIKKFYFGNKAISVETFYQFLAVSTLFCSIYYIEITVYLGKF